MTSGIPDSYPMVAGIPNHEPKVSGIPNMDLRIPDPYNKTGIPVSIPEVLQHCSTISQWEGVSIAVG